MLDYPAQNHPKRAKSDLAVLFVACVRAWGVQGQVCAVLRCTALCAALRAARCALRCVLCCAVVRCAVLRCAVLRCAVLRCAVLVLLPLVCPWW